MPPARSALAPRRARLKRSASGFCTRKRRPPGPVGPTRAGSLPDGPVYSTRERAGWSCILISHRSASARLKLIGFEPLGARLQSERGRPFPPSHARRSKQQDRPAEDVTSPGSLTRITGRQDTVQQKTPKNRNLLTPASRLNFDRPSQAASNLCDWCSAATVRSATAPPQRPPARHARPCQLERPPGCRRRGAQTPQRPRPAAAIRPSRRQHPPPTQDPRSPARCSSSLHSALLPATGLSYQLLPTRQRTEASAIQRMCC